MPRSHVGTISPQVQALLEAKSLSPSPDELLLERFVSRRDDVAFETLVRRHGPMVLAVCRGVLNDREAAEDAAQATFLVLVRKAGSVRAGSSLGSWLYRVAYNMATQINVDAARRRESERRAAQTADATRRSRGREDDLIPALYEEIERLPEKYRLPVVLCHLEQMTHARAASHLQWTVGTVRGRVADARELLRNRLARRGLTLSAVTMALIFGESSTATNVAAAWLEATVAAAAVAAGRRAAAGAVSPAVLALSDRMLTAMFMTKLKLILAALMAAAAVIAATATMGIAGFVPASAAQQTPAGDTDAAKQRPVGLVTADPIPETAAKKLAAGRLTVMKTDAARYRFPANKETAQPAAALVPEPILRWSNPVAEEEDAGLFLWTRGGKPEAAAALFVRKDIWMHEFQSLSESSFSAEWDGRPVWSPSKPGLRFQAVRAAQPPGKTAVQRLRQMRTIAGSFTAWVEFHYAEKSRYELRLLPTPVYRYGSPDREPIDGSLWAFVQGTNPEVVLLIEARRTEGNPGGQWHYALAAMTSYKAEVLSDGQSVWTVDRQPIPTPDTRGPYLFRYLPSEARQ